MITSLHQAIGRLERDRDHHLQRIQSLEEEVRRLADMRGDVTESLLERKVEGLRQEMWCELRHLQDRMREPPRVSSPSLRSTTSILQEVNESKRLLWKEYESLRRDTDYLHQRLRRQEDDLLRQISEGQELRRAHFGSAIGDLKEEVRVLEGKLSVGPAKVDKIERPRFTRKPASKSPSLSSLEDAQSQLSLADISSEDTSYSLGVPTVSRGM
ncbi:coiled-coil domain-containing protein 159 [Pyxicephalus adspersus]|uniref:coiled-coil domain-containing protein 159 n=1 Tax=Pyxicephalus adspersus TaxID=30357 RepID=UPI003B5C10FF